MATRQQVRQMTTSQPFRPFLITLSGGRSFTVRHPETVACSLDGRDMTVYDDDGVHLIDMYRVEVIEPIQAPAKPGPDGNGA